MFPITAVHAITTTNQIRRRFVVLGNDYSRCPGLVPVGYSHVGSVWQRR